MGRPGARARRGNGACGFATKLQIEAERSTFATGHLKTQDSINYQVVISDMSDFKYSDIERQIAEALPELRSAAEFYWKREGLPGLDCGPYIFFESMFACYVCILLAMPASSKRDRLLSRAFDLA
jgi:hypothetical protein